MKKRIFLAGILAGVLLALSSCGAKSPQEQVSKALGIDASAGVVRSSMDTHSGNGDGTSCIALQFEEDQVVEEIRTNTQWKSFPLDRTVTALVYGVTEGSSQWGPFISDDQGSGTPLVPEIKNGYYCLIDRFQGSDQKADPGLLDRGAFNVTVGLYDTDSHILYCCELDT